MSNVVNPARLIVWGYIGTATAVLAALDLAGVSPTALKAVAMAFVLGAAAVAYLMMNRWWFA